MNKITAVAWGIINKKNDFIVLECPICGNKHFHGVSHFDQDGSPSIFQGYRTSHCDSESMMKLRNNNSEKLNILSSEYILIAEEINGRKTNFIGLGKPNLKFVS
jgi:transposase-like protein